VGGDLRPGADCRQHLCHPERGRDGHRGSTQGHSYTGERARVEAPSTQKLEAWEAYQLGRQQLAKRTSGSLAEAERHFRRAIEIDPEFAVAYVGVADTLLLRLGFTGYPPAATLSRADEAIARALALDPNLAEAVAGAAGIALLRQDYAAAEAGFHRAIALSPSSATAYHGCSRLYGLMGRTTTR